MTYFTLAAAMLATGVAGGLLAGLLGVGGGIVIVPILDLTLQILDVDAEVRLHVAIATSLATIVPTSVASFRAHQRRGALDSDLARYWGPGILVGAVAGTALAALVSGSVLAAVFGSVALLVAIKMLLPLDDYRLSSDVPRGVGGLPLPLGVGALSSMMGIGGGTLSVPLLTLFGRPIHLAVGTGAFFGLIISVPATLGYIAAGWSIPNLPPASLGYVNLVGFALIAPMTVLFAPLGARIAHALSKRQLSAAFGIFLALVALRMFSRL